MISFNAMSSTMQLNAIYAEENLLPIKAAKTSVTKGRYSIIVMSPEFIVELLNLYATRISELIQKISKFHHPQPQRIRFTPHFISSEATARGSQMHRFEHRALHVLFNWWSHFPRFMSVHASLA